MNGSSSSWFVRVRRPRVLLAIMMFVVAMWSISSWLSVSELSLGDGGTRTTNAPRLYVAMLHRTSTAVLTSDCSMVAAV